VASICCWHYVDIHCGFESRRDVVYVDCTVMYANGYGGGQTPKGLQWHRANDQKLLLFFLVLKYIDIIYLTKKCRSSA
jgi:hypothetical protein